MAAVMTGVFSAEITPDIAAHVLSHFNAGGYEAGSFVQQLLVVIARADVLNRVALGQVYPGYVKAVVMAQDDPAGVDELRQVLVKAHGTSQ